MDWQYDVSIADLNEHEFLREAAWVIFSSGMSERVVRSKFGDISRAFFDWTSAEMIVANATTCKAEAFQYFGHESKLNAVIEIASHISREGFPFVVKSVMEGGIDYLQQFAFIGPATSHHLAKNIGLPFAKPDRHLTRMADRLGYQCVQELCADIALATAEPISIVDLVLWRFSVEHSRYVHRFSKGFLQASEEE